jgi:hypothetical protein
MAFSLTLRGRPVRRRDQRTRWNGLNCTPLEGAAWEASEAEAAQFKQLTGGGTCRQLPPNSYATALFHHLMRGQSRFGIKDIRVSRPPGRLDAAPPFCGRC